MSRSPAGQFAGAFLATVSVCLSLFAWLCAYIHALPGDSKETVLMRSGAGLRKRSLRFGAAVLSGLLLAVLAAGPAVAAQPKINVNAMVAYALKWSKVNGEMDAQYPVLTNNCANFASQALAAGGWEPTSALTPFGSGVWTYKPAVGDATRTWSKALLLHSYVASQGWHRMKHRKGVNGWIAPWQAQRGDLLFVDWDDDEETIDHVMVVTGTTWSEAWQTNVPLISQQSNARHNIPLTESIRLARKDDRDRRITWYGLSHEKREVGRDSVPPDGGHDPSDGIGAPSGSDAGSSGGGSSGSGTGSGGGGGGSSAPPARSPVGAFDGAVARLGGAVEVNGWAFDPDAPTQPVDIHVYVGGPAGVGIGHNLGPAKLSRPDVGKAYPAAGPDHGFTRTITGVPAGKQAIYVYAYNVGAGTNTLLGDKEVTIASGKPFGFLDGATAARNGTAQLDGWAIDPDEPTEPVDIHVYVDGPAGVAKVGHNLGPAKLSRADVAAAHAGAGDKHGFSTKISGLGPGKHTLYFYAINRGPGDNALLGAREVVVPVELPFGYLDVAEGRYMGEAYVAGWAIDPESPGFRADIHVYVDGPAGSGAQGFNLAGATLSRPDVEAAHPGRGKNHGFDRVITGLSAGKHTLYVYAVGAAGHRLLASKQITVGAGFVGAGGAAVPGSSLAPGTALRPGQALLSPRRQYALVMQHDGNLVLYHLTGVIWHPVMTAFAGAFAAMQTDGNFVVYRTSGQPVWATMTNGKPGSALHLQDDGNLVVYHGAAPVWWRTMPGVRLL